MNSFQRHADISVLIATYNRADVLQRTLTNMAGLDCTGITVEFVVIDNNSSDHTREVVDSFGDRLPIVYLFEPKPGKNCALNKALNEIELGELVVFTDDDVNPNPDWLQIVVEVSHRWPDVSVFGGKVSPVWPCDLPEWLMNQPEDFLVMTYGIHDCGDAEVYYGDHTKLKEPFGPNFWLRKSVFAHGLRFNEHIGPRPKDRIMGGESSFLKGLADDGYKMVYSPASIIGHCISDQQITKEYLLKRVATKGRSNAVLSSEFKNTKMYTRSKLLWYLCRYYSLIKHVLRKYASFIMRDETAAIQKRLDAELWIAYNCYYLKNHKELFIRCQK